jgi:hypothetical protein
MHKQSSNMHAGSGAWSFADLFLPAWEVGKGFARKRPAALLCLQLPDLTITLGSMISLIANKHSVFSNLKHHVSLIGGLGSRSADGEQVTKLRSVGGFHKYLMVFLSAFLYDE